jgi:hypothetical protein
VIVIPHTHTQKKKKQKINKKAKSERGALRVDAIRRQTKKRKKSWQVVSVGQRGSCHTVGKKRKPDQKRRFSTFHLVVVLCLFIPFFVKCIGDKEQTVVKVKSNF